MLIFMTGASGFIGRALTALLAARGHAIVAATRSPFRQFFPSSRVRNVIVDFGRVTNADQWRRLIAGADAVVNAVGILRETGDQTFTRLHVEAPRALFSACASEGIQRVVQISALGADEHAVTGYHRSKRAGDAALLETVPTGICAQPSLVYGRGGASARLFTMLAALPIIPIPTDGEQQIQPIDLDDLVNALCVLIEEGAASSRVPLVGPEPTTLRQVLVDLRTAMRLDHGRFISIPRWLVRTAARLGDFLPFLLFTSESWAMLERGNIAEPACTARLLGHRPRPTIEFIRSDEAQEVRTEARLRFLLPVLRTSVAFVWIVTGIVSLGVYPVEESYALLARAAVPAALAPLLLYGAALIDIALGVLVFVLHGDARRWLWRTQMGLIVGYTAIITWALPEYWLHPYGPVTKNLPLLAALWILDALEDAQ